jgi:wyosine [tRNA(Phe)-imidazoG37] synthetase (radical SAM superfamily)
MSLGIDIVPQKVCSLDCVYCEAGKTTCFTTERKEYVAFGKVKEELLHYFSNNSDPDYITFSGNGEPSLNIIIGDIIEFIKEKKPNIPVAVITNGTLLNNKDVRSSIMSADLVLPSLDAATDAVFQRINRPVANLKIENHIEGLIEFSKEFKGKIWLEIFILPGYNDSENELAELKKLIIQIKADSVQLNTLDRPGTESDLRGATRAELQHIADSWNLENLIIISSTPVRKNIKSYREDIENAILETISRRPCTINDLAEILGLQANQINKYLDVLEADGKISTSKQERGIFYQKIVK